MLSGEAARLAAIEVLCPTAANKGEIPFPTLAGRNVFDSRATAVNDLAEGLRRTPTVAVYSRDAMAERRGGASVYGDNEARVVLEFVIEIAVLVDDTDGGEPIAWPEAGSDPQARAVLMALAAQVRRLLEHSESGALFRRTIKAVERIDWEPYVVADIGLRFQRVTMKMVCAVGDDVFTDAAGLPEPLRSLHEALPTDSYAKAKLAELAAAFAGEIRTPLEVVTLAPTDGDVIAEFDMEQP